jgi:hypothetical protein
MELALLEGMELVRIAPPDIYFVIISILLSKSVTLWFVDYYFTVDPCDF